MITSPNDEMKALQHAKIVVLRNVIIKDIKFVRSHGRELKLTKSYHSFNEKQVADINDDWDQCEQAKYLTSTKQSKL